MCSIGNVSMLDLMFYDYVKICAYLDVEWTNDTWMSFHSPWRCGHLNVSPHILSKAQSSILNKPRQTIKWQVFTYHIQACVWAVGVVKEKTNKKQTPDSSSQKPCPQSQKDVIIPPVHTGH